MKRTGHIGWKDISNQFFTVLRLRGEEKDFSEYYEKGRLSIVGMLDGEKEEFYFSLLKITAAPACEKILSSELPTRGKLEMEKDNNIHFEREDST